MTVTIALDAMGGDFGPSVTVPAAVDVVGQFPEVELILVGLKEQLEPALRKVGYNGSRVRIHHASQVVEMDEPAAQALRGKKDSSLRVSINLVHSGEAQGCVSAGNTGALMATARFVLKTLHGIDRPAIVTTLPSRRGHVHMLDLGANVDSPPERLVQFGIMGSELVRALDDIAEPKVGLLNIGVEDIKGDQVIKKAAELMRLSKLNFQGFIEGDGIYLGDMDVIVCDGFVGNVALKTSEGLAQWLMGMMRSSFKKNIFTMLAGFIALPVVRSLRKHVDHRRYNGASLVGLRKTVIKSHGGADKLAFKHAICEAIAEVKKDVPTRIAGKLKAIHEQGVL